MHGVSTTATTSVIRHEPVMRAPTREVSDRRMNHHRPTTVVIADDDSGVRAALADLIVESDGLELAGIGETGDDAAALCAIHRPDVAVVDVMMPGGGETAVVAIRSVSPTTAVVVYTARADRRTRARMIDAGAVLVLPKHGHHDVARELARIATKVATAASHQRREDGR